MIPFDTGSTAFVLISAALVMIMTPGLGLFYGGLIGKKNVLTIMLMSMFSLGWVTILWVIYGFTMSFGPDIGGIIGGSRYLLMNNIYEKTSIDNVSIPMYAYSMFQLMFAVITPALITGAFANKMKFKAWIVFLTLWATLVYFPLAHWVWGGGFLQKWGVEDFAGGLVVHTSAGFSALATALWFGALSKEKDKPHNLVLVALGTALLWFGWFGFNAGSALRAGGDAAIAFANTQIAAAFASITWILLDVARRGKVSVTGFCTGAIAGLATITPAAGYVSAQSAMLIGIVASLVAYGAVIYKNKKGWDDVLDVWGVHGMGGFTGIVMLGLLGSSAILGENGLIYGGLEFFAKEVVAAVFVATYAFILTWIILWLTSKITKMRVSAEELGKGIDYVELGETGYSW